MVCPSFAWGAPFATGAVKCTRFKDSKEKKKVFLAKWIQGWKFCCQSVVRLADDAKTTTFSRSIFFISKSHIDPKQICVWKVQAISLDSGLIQSSCFFIYAKWRIRESQMKTKQTKEWRYMRLLVVRALSRSFPGNEKWISPGVTSKIKGFLCGDKIIE